MQTSSRNLPEPQLLAQQPELLTFIQDLADVAGQSVTRRRARSLRKALYQECVRTHLVINDQILGQYQLLGELDPP